VRAENTSAEGDTRDAQGKLWEARFMQTITDMTANASGQTKDGTPSVLARLIIVSRKLADADGSFSLYREACLAASMLKASPTQSAAVSAIIDDIEFSSSRNSPIYTVMRGVVRSVLCFFTGGAALLAMFALPYGLSVASSSATPVGAAAAESLRYYGVSIVNTLFTPTPVAIVFGFLGSVVSILLRLSDFERATRRSQQFLLMTGTMLPLVGATFAAVTTAMFVSGIINFQFANGGTTQHEITTLSFFVVIGFMSGFSERFTRGLLGTTVNSLTGGHMRGGSQADADAISDSKGSKAM
jgi:hypothetical protein